MIRTALHGTALICTVLHYTTRFFFILTSCTAKNYTALTSTTRLCNVQYFTKMYCSDFYKKSVRICKHGLTLVLHHSLPIHHPALHAALHTALHAALNTALHVALHTAQYLLHCTAQCTKPQCIAPHITNRVDFSLKLVGNLLIISL